MDDVHEPAGATGQARGRHESRVDELFAQAIEQQLSEQRALNRIVASVDEALVALRGSLGELYDHISGSTEPIVASVDAAHRDLAELLRRVEQRDTTLRGELPRLLGGPLDDLAERLLATIVERDERRAVREDEAGRALSEAQRSLNEQSERLGRVRGALEAAVEEQSAIGRALGEETVERLRAAADEVAASLRGEVEHATGSVREHLVAVHEEISAVGDAVAGLRETEVESVESLRGALDAARAGLTAVSEGVVERLDERVGVATGAVQAAVERLEAAVEEQTASGRAVGEETVERVRDLVDDTAVALRAEAEQVATVASERLAAESRAGVDRLEQVAADLGERLIGLHEGGLATLDEAVEGLHAAARDLTSGAEARLGDLAERLDDTVERLTAGFEDGLAAVGTALERAERVDERVEAAIRRAVAAAERQALTVAEAVRADLAVAVGENRRTGERMNAAVDAVEQLQAGLLGYLAQRDAAFEERRDLVLGELLEEFGAGLSRRERKRAVARLGEVRQHSRDRRDAERFREQQGGQGPSPIDVDMILSPPRPAPAAADDHDDRACAECGFVAKTAAGLAAHRRNHV